MGRDERKPKSCGGVKVEVVDSRTEEQKRIEQAARELKAAMEGLGTDEEALIRIIVGNSNKELQLIKNHYLLTYKQVALLTWRILVSL